MIATLKRDLAELGAAIARSGPGGTATSAALTDSFAVTTLFRLRHALGRLPGASHALRLVQTAVFGCEIDREVTLGAGVYFVHPLGTVVGGTSRLGERVRLMGNNTVGTRHDDGYPIIGDDVTLGAGARVLGPIRIGAGATVGAGAVVIDDVEAGGVVAGVPARPVSHRKEGGTRPHLAS